MLWVDSLPIDGMDVLTSHEAGSIWKDFGVPTIVSKKPEIVLFPLFFYRFIQLEATLYQQQVSQHISVFPWLLSTPSIEEAPLVFPFHTHTAVHLLLLLLFYLSAITLGATEDASADELTHIPTKEKMAPLLGRERRS